MGGRSVLLPRLYFVVKHSVILCLCVEIFYTFRGLICNSLDTENLYGDKCGSWTGVWTRMVPSALRCHRLRKGTMPIVSCPHWPRNAVGCTIDRRAMVFNQGHYGDNRGTQDSWWNASGCWDKWNFPRPSTSRQQELDAWTQMQQT